jgi:serine/threonine protein phosphatase PrpC
MHRDIAERYPASGTTLTAVVVERRRLQIAYVGDSEAWLCGDGIFLRLTVPHRYRDHRFERQRIDGCRGISVRNGYLVLHDGSALAMTRALGDCDFDPYVLHAPELRTIAIEPGQTFLLVGSDGMWDALIRRHEHRQATCEVLHNANTAVEAVDRLLAELDRKMLHDNATLVAIDLRGWSADPQSGS